MASPRRSTKRRSTKRRSSKRRLSPKMVSWTKKLMAWRKANKHKDGSLPSLKQAMKACKGKSSRRSKCRKNAGRHAKKTSSKRRSMKKSAKRGSSKRRSMKKGSKKRSSKRRSSKRRSAKKGSKKRSAKKGSKKRSSKRRSSKRRSAKKGSKKRSSKRRSSKRRSKKMHGGAGYRTKDGFYYYDVPRPMSPTQVAWNAKLQAWRQANRKADGSLPSMKAAMKACKGRAAPEKNCRKGRNHGKYPMTAQWKEFGTRAPKSWADCGPWNEWKNKKSASSASAGPMLMLTN